MLMPCLLAVTGFDLWGAVMAMGLVCTLYTALVSDEIFADYCFSATKSKQLNGDFLKKKKRYKG